MRLPIQAAAIRRCHIAQPLWCCDKATDIVPSADDPCAKHGSWPHCNICEIGCGGKCYPGGWYYCKDGHPVRFSTDSGKHPFYHDSFAYKIFADEHIVIASESGATIDIPKGTPLDFAVHGTTLVP